MNKYKYETGLFHGRFQHIHIRHQRIIDEMLSDCQSAILLIGNCQSYGTETDPFNIIERINLIKEIYGDNKRLTIGFFPDLHDIPKTEEDYAKWGNWILSFCKYFADKNPDVIYGGSPTKLEWLYGNHVISFKKIKRDDLSATLVRDYLREGDRKAWEKATDPRIHSCFLKLSRVVRACSKNNQKEG